jgi:glucuronate isomerase
MKQFMDEDFLLETPTARMLYQSYAKDMPIYDYHCHLQPKEIWENQKYENITQVWLGGDHYKWRMMRAMGVDEKDITGDGSDYDKFQAWAKTLPQCIGNPLYHWTHLELQRFFDITDTLSSKTADKVWKTINDKLQGEGFRPRDFIEKSNVAVICTTDDPVDDLKYHKLIAEEGALKTKVLPTFRPDKAVEINKDGFADYIGTLSKASGTEITNVQQVCKALAARMEFFHDMGCRLSDHGIEMVPYCETSAEEVDAIFKKALSGQKVSLEEEAKYKTAVLVFCGKQYARLGWVMQIHMNAIRNNNTRMFEKLGPDTGYDSIYDQPLTLGLSKFLNELDREDQLPKVILYSLNPNDNAVLVSMMGNFQGGIPGKLQLGSAWWFNDHKDGMEQQMRDLANMGVFGQFVGMLTDSRSFLSYPRHEYFRRILCNLMGNWVESGQYPCDWDVLGGMVRGICYENIRNYIGI